MVKKIIKGEYNKYDKETGELIHVNSLDECLESIRIRIEDYEDQIKQLLEENLRLKKELKQ
jgi:hypothetical protein